MFTGDMSSGDELREQFFMNNVTINFNVFSVFMENLILSNVESGLVITIKEHGLRMEYLKIKKQFLKPSEFTCGGSKRTIFSFGRRTRDCGLLLGTPRDGTVTKLDKKTNGRAPGKWTTSPIRVGIGRDL